MATIMLACTVLVFLTMATPAPVVTAWQCRCDCSDEGSSGDDQGLMPPILPLSLTATTTECQGRVAARLLDACGPYLSGGQEHHQAMAGTGTRCCGELANYLRATADPAADRKRIQCLCPGMVSRLNTSLGKPVDAALAMYAPVSCGLKLPPQTMFVCHRYH